MADVNQNETATQAAENQGSNEWTNTLAAIYHKATTTYEHLMSPIREINEYVDAKNELDAGFEQKSMSEEAYNEKVKELQTKYFGADESRLSLANKFEAVQDWQDAHGITEIRESVSGAATNIKDAFYATSVGQKFETKFEEIKLAAAEMGKDEKTEEHASTEAADKNENAQKTSSDRSTNVYSDLGIEDMDENVSAQVDGFQK